MTHAAGCDKPSDAEVCLENEAKGIYLYSMDNDCGCARSDCSLSPGLVCYQGSCCNPASGPDACGRSPSWSVGGNAGTTSTHFLGTSDGQPLRLKANGELAVEIGADRAMTVYGPATFDGDTVFESACSVNGNLTVHGQFTAASLAGAMTSADTVIATSVEVGGDTTTGNLDVGGLATAGSLDVEYSTTTSTLDVSFQTTTATLDVSGLARAGSVDVSESVTAGSLGVSGPAAADSLQVWGAASAGALEVSGSTETDSLQVRGTTTTEGLKVNDLATFDSLSVDGLTSTEVLEIRGGSDLAEPFEVIGGRPGMVVVIDERSTERLRPCSTPYDRRVIGVISGAGGVKPGLILSQSEALSGTVHVALSGRVYVLADASAAQITPGDLLTTSHRAGHAMKVTDHELAQGAILGKALSPLEQGQGLVLMLVTLQ